eukprot:RCo045812
MAFRGVHGHHLGQNGQGVDLELHRGLLSQRQVVGVGANSKSGDIRAGVNLVLQHQLSPHPVKAGHAFDGHGVGPVLLLQAAHRQHGRGVALLHHPLVGVHRQLHPQGFGQHQHVARHGLCGLHKVPLGAHCGGHPPDQGPGVEHRLASQAPRVSQRAGIRKALHHELRAHLAVLLGHLPGHPQEHQHVVTVRHPHGVQVGQHIGTRDPTLHVGVVDEGEEEVSGLDQEHPGIPLQGEDGAVQPGLLGGQRRPRVRAAAPQKLPYPGILQELQQLGLGHLAATALELRVVRQHKALAEAYGLGVEAVHPGAGMRILNTSLCNHPKKDAEE